MNQKYFFVTSIIGTHNSGLFDQRYLCEEIVKEVGGPQVFYIQPRDGIEYLFKVIQSIYRSNAIASMSTNATQVDDIFYFMSSNSVCVVFGYPILRSSPVGGLPVGRDHGVSDIYILKCTFYKGRIQHATHKRLRAQRFNFGHPIYAACNNVYLVTFLYQPLNDWLADMSCGSGN